MLNIWTTLGTPNQKEIQIVPRNLTFCTQKKNGPQEG